MIRRILLLILILWLSACSGTPMNGVPAGDQTVAGATQPPPAGHLSFQASVNAALGVQIWNGLYYKLTIQADHCTIVMHAFGTTFTHHGTWTQDVRQGFFNYFTLIPDDGWAIDGFSGEYASQGTEFTTYADGDQTVVVANPQTAGG